MELIILGEIIQYKPNDSINYYLEHIDTDNIYMTHRQQCGASRGNMQWGQVETNGTKWGQMGTKRDFAWGDAKCR